MFNWLRRLFGAGTATSAGDRGERLAAEWLERERGFRIVARNWRSPHDRRDELDVIAREGEALVFVEVKTRAADALVPGYYAVDERKKRVVRRAAAAYRRGLRETAAGLQQGPKRGRPAPEAASKGGWAPRGRGGGHPGLRRRQG